MQKILFKTNIKCASCVAASTSYLNEAAGEGNWKVDTSDPRKLLVINSAEPLDPSAVVEAVNKAGYQAEEII
jgi:copper chaperone CopZ